MDVHQLLLEDDLHLRRGGDAPALRGAPFADALGGAVDRAGLDGDGELQDAGLREARAEDELRHVVRAFAVALLAARGEELPRRGEDRPVAARAEQQPVADAAPEVVRHRAGAVRAAGEVEDAVRPGGEHGGAGERRPDGVGGRVDRVREEADGEAAAFLRVDVARGGVVRVDDGRVGRAAADPVHDALGGAVEADEGGEVGDGAEVGGDEALQGVGDVRGAELAQVLEARELAQEALDGHHRHRGDGAVALDVAEHVEPVAARDRERLVEVARDGVLGLPERRVERPVPDERARRQHRALDLRGEAELLAFRERADVDRGKALGEGDGGFRVHWSAILRQPRGKGKRRTKATPSGRGASLPVQGRDQ